MTFFSPDGVCHSFDHRANGYARGDGIGGVLLKTVRQAVADGDTIRAVIRGTGLNQDGKTPGIRYLLPYCKVLEYAPQHDFTRTKLMIRSTFIPRGIELTPLSEFSLTLVCVLSYAFSECAS
jgi:hypothetical protein